MKPTFVLWLILGALFVISAEIRGLRPTGNHDGGWYGAAALAFTGSLLHLAIDVLRKKP